MGNYIKKLFDYFSSFNRTVWLLVFATFLESFGRFLVIPYLSIYLSKKGVSLPSIGAVIGIGPLAAVIFSMIGGHLSDTLGRKPVQIIGVVLSGVSFLGFALSGTNLILLAIFNFLTTMTRTFYRPAVNAAIADVTSANKRSEAMSLSRVSLNLAYGLAPIVGVYLANQDKPYGFIIGAVLSLIVALFIAIMVPETSIGLKKEKQSNETKFNYKSILQDRAFLLWTFANMLMVGVYSYISSFLPIEITKKNIGLSIYGILLSINAFVCTLFQIPVSIIFGNKNMGKVAFFSMIGYIVGFFLFGFSKIPFLLMIGMFILSTGEIIHAAVNVRFVPEIAPKGLIGRYMGLSGFQELGPFIFSIFGGFLMNNYGGKALFTLAAISSFFAGILKFLADKLNQKNKGMV
ncbi:MAG: MFS transporter [Exilispira sp.]|jgi:MFS family permease|nr:MFS transporter [Exilispira sp.]